MDFTKSSHLVLYVYAIEREQMSVRWQRSFRHKKRKVVTQGHNSQMEISPSSELEEIIHYLKDILIIQKNLFYTIKFKIINRDTIPSVMIAKVLLPNIDVIITADNLDRLN